MRVAGRVLVAAFEFPLDSFADEIRSVLAFSQNPRFAAGCASHPTFSIMQNRCKASGTA